jgi:hypothetical protein
MTDFPEVVGVGAVDDDGTSLSGQGSDFFEKFFFAVIAPVDGVFPKRGFAKFRGRDNVDACPKVSRRPNCKTQFLPGERGGVADRRDNGRRTKGIYRGPEKESRVYTAGVGDDNSAECAKVVDQSGIDRAVMVFMSCGCRSFPGDRTSPRAGRC